MTPDFGSFEGTDGKVFLLGPQCHGLEGIRHRQGLAAVQWPLQNEGIECDTAQPRRILGTQRARTPLRAGMGLAKVEGKYLRDFAEPEKWVNLQTRLLVRFRRCPRNFHVLGCSPKSLRAASIWQSLLWGCFALARAMPRAFPRATDAPPARGLSCNDTQPCWGPAAGGGSTCPRAVLLGEQGGVKTFP